MTGFANFDEYLAVPRISALTLSPDGTRLVAVIASLNDRGDTLVPALWDVDPTGRRDAAQLTRSSRGETSPSFAADGSVLFVSARGTDEDAPASLWRLPAAGEPVELTSRAGGIDSVVAARADGTAVFAAPTLPGADDAEADRARRTARKDLEVSAVLYRETPVRHWDHDLGPAQPRLFALAPGATEPVDLTPEPGRTLDEQSYAVSPDGATVVTGWVEHTGPARRLGRLVAIDVATGARRVLAEDSAASFGDPAISGDGSYVICVREQETTYDDPPRLSLWLVDLRDGSGRELVADPDIWPREPCFGTDPGTVYFVADERGHAPVFRLDTASDTWTRVTATGHHSSVSVSPDGALLYALRDAWDSPPRPVRVDARGSDVAAEELPAPGAVTVTRPLERVSATAADGTTIEAWLALPEGAGSDAPAPLLLWMHGGPLGSWNGWSWRWNPWLMVGRGYAVLLPDPALSTGYGARMIARGWGQWGGTPFTDLMTITDAVVARADVDESRTAAMGGSYGGYLANWVAGHTDRFRCLVAHASLWCMEQFQGTTDSPDYWAQEWGIPSERPERYAQWSPHRFLDRIRTPMLVIHGDRDYRVPVSEALRLWWDLQRTGVESAYLYFPDEGHWVLKPGNARVWYETVWAWLAEHLHGEAWRQPELL